MSTHITNKYKTLSLLFTFFAIFLNQPRPAYGLTCSILNIDTLNFGNIMPLTNNTATTSLTIHYSCTKELLDTFLGATLCLNIGNSSTSSQIVSRQMSPIGINAPISYQLYQNANYSLIWGSQYISDTSPVMIKLNIGQGSTPTTGSVTVYAQLSLNPSTVIPATYIDTYTSLTASSTLNIGLLSTPNSCGSIIGPTFPFTVTTTVNKQCIVSASGDIHLGNVKSQTTNTTANGNISVTCTNTTPFSIGLLPSNNNLQGAGFLQSPTTTDQIPYQLSSTPGPNGIIWGNNLVNLFSDIGSGIAKLYPVYVTVPSANYQPGNYSDTVTVNASY
ncbi:Csu type fimbrial protein [Providencia stuartii]|uniref:Csu type fimbrial protein n=1 Tax=Providencia sp. PROV189 TaxID=2949890 RepID=UPI00234A40BF|nr:spore coat protein U domain-containing protein [Providencia sp. PROV189]